MSKSVIGRLFSGALTISIGLTMLLGVAAASAATTASHIQTRTSGLVRASQALTTYWNLHAASARTVNAPVSTVGASASVAATPQGPAVRIAGARGSLAASDHANPSPDVAWPGSRSTAPATTTGKVFFTDHTGGNWVCSGSLLNSPAKNIVITAGHCVYGTAGGELPAGETWHSNWVFAPDYANGVAPYGYWTAHQLWTLTNYINNGDEQDDLGAVVLNSNSAGTKAVNLLGGQGYAYNEPSSESVYSFGYPQGAPFNGETLQYCDGSDSYSTLIDLEVLKCNFTGGSSGGPWLMDFNGQYGYINSVVDTGGYGAPLTGDIAGLYFGNNAGSLYNAVANL
jgi:V8-like Glu-specific endopeptidase